jgi:hypothetical protein
MFFRLEQMNIENVHLLCKDLPANPCHEIVAYGGQSPPATISRALLRFASQGQGILSG